MKKLLENADRVDRDAFEREQERLRREREAIDEMAGALSEETKKQKTPAKKEERGE